MHTRNKTTPFYFLECQGLGAVRMSNTLSLDIHLLSVHLKSFPSVYNQSTLSPEWYVHSSTMRTYRPLECGVFHQRSRYYVRAIPTKLDNISLMPSVFIHIFTPQIKARPSSKPGRPK